MKPAYFFIRCNRKYERVYLKELVYVESCRGYLKLVCESRTWMVYSTLLKLEQLLPPDHFCRIHRSYLVSIDKVSSFDKHWVYVKEGTAIHKLPVGEKDYETALLDRVVTMGEAEQKVKQAV